MGETAIKIGDWLVDRDKNSIIRGDLIRHLQPLSVDVLLYLARHRDRVVTTKELVDTLWTRRLVGDDAVHRRIADLRKNLGDDTRNPNYILTISKRGYRLIASVQAEGSDPETPPASRRPLGRRVAIAVLVIGLVALALTIRAVNHRNDREIAVAIASAESLLARDEYQAAYEELRPVLEHGDVTVRSLVEKLVLPVSIFTDSPGIDIAYRYPAPGSEWRSLGVTPLHDVSLPRGHYKLRIGDRLLMDASNPGVTLNSADQARRVVEVPAEPPPDGMVYIPAGKYRLGAWGFIEEFDLGGFHIDRYEVSNRDYREFVDDGGYANPAYWQHLIDASDGRLTWAGVRRMFVDRTNRPGPGGWELGTYPAGEETLPVVGISWYEANAYLTYRDKVLPGAHHWLRAALGPMEWKYPFAPSLVPRSNVAAERLLPVDRESSADVNGTFDMIGNAAEWTALESGGSKAVIGASFRDPAWAYNFPQPLDPMQRADNIGFRGMRYAPDTATDPLPEFPLFNDFSGSIRRISDKTFAGMAHSFAYTSGTVNAAYVTVVGEQVHEDWTRREVLIPTSRPDDPLPVILFIPRRHAPPFQSVIFLPPADSWSPGFRSDSIDIANYQLDFVPRSGRVLIWPVYSGSHERYDNYHADSGAERGGRALERNRRIRDETGRVIDYLAGTPEFDGSSVALVALSYGATIAPMVLSTESRIQSAVIFSAGIAPPVPVFANPLNDPNVYWARVNQPTLLMNGRYDPIRPHQFVLNPLLGLLATAPDSRKIILYESGHWPLPRHLMMRDTTDWLDRFLGPTTLRILPDK